MFEIVQHVFSSPEHNLLKVSFCDDPLSVIHHLCVRLSIINFFKQLLLINNLANIVKTLQGRSLHEALQKLLIKFHEEL